LGLASVERTLRWVPLVEMHTREQAHSFYGASYEGPTKEVMHTILHVFRDAFEFAADTNWSYTERLELYHSFPLKELPTTDAVPRFRPVLFGCPAFTKGTDVDMTPPKSE
jgi:hypothetical protein